MSRNYYAEINLHGTWHTKDSLPLLLPKVEAVTHHYLRGRCINTPGVFVHVHDITLPYLYPPDALVNPWAWQETTLLLALLTHNPRLSVLACESALHHDRPADLAEILSDYRPRTQQQGLDVSGNSQAGTHFPASIWLRTG